MQQWYLHSEPSFLFLLLLLPIIYCTSLRYSIVHAAFVCVVFYCYYVYCCCCCFEKKSPFSSSSSYSSPPSSSFLLLIYYNFLKLLLLFIIMIITTANNNGKGDGMMGDYRKILCQLLAAVFFHLADIPGGRDEPRHF